MQCSPSGSRTFMSHIAQEELLYFGNCITREDEHSDCEGTKAIPDICQVVAKTNMPHYTHLHVLPQHRADKGVHQPLKGGRS